ncbi:MAG: ABC transporter permease [Hydrogenophilaceae bacterium]|nr:ABC transporter permease [Hydrogenophilaceae bacterium]
MADPSLEVVKQAGQNVLRLSGHWTLAHLPSVAVLPSIPVGPLMVDGSDLTGLDPSGAHRLIAMLRQSGIRMENVQTRAMPSKAAQVWALVADRVRLTEGAESARPQGLLYQIGLGTAESWQHFMGVTNFIGRVVTEWLGLFRRPGAFRLKEFTAQMEGVFVYAIPIVFAMIFLLGVVFAYLLGVQAQKFGANIFVVDGVAAAILREISPVIVAILIAGRSGAAMTAQLGTMKVNEEIDALSVLGLSPYVVLVLPRILALLLAMPLLVFVGDVAGLLGGMLVANAQLGIEYSQFWDRLDSVLKMKTLLIGLGKAPVFAVFIGLIACRMGLTVSRDARSVGVNTTSTVVQSIVAVIVLNALFAVAFSDIGI